MRQRAAHPRDRGGGGQRRQRLNRRSEATTSAAIARLTIGRPAATTLIFNLFEGFIFLHLGILFISYLITVVRTTSGRPR